MIFNRKRKFTTSLALVAALLFLIQVVSCKKDDNDDTRNLIILGYILSNLTASTSSTSMVTVPDTLTNSSSTSSSSKVVGDTSDTVGGRNAKALPEGTASLMGSLFEPIRTSIKQGSDLMVLAGEWMDISDTLVSKYPSLLNSAVRYTNDDGTGETILSLADSTTFGSGGKKMEIWSGATGAADTAFTKVMELDYTRGLTTIDGVIFLQLPNSGYTTGVPVIVRIEFEKKGDGEKNVVVHGQGFKDWNNNTSKPGSAAYVMQGTTSGDVIVEGGYTIAGPKMPFLEQNLDSVTNNNGGSTGNNLCSGTDCWGWGSSDVRVYMFSAAGSQTDGLGVANLIVPKGSEAPTNYSDASSSPGQLYTDAFLKYFTLRDSSNNYKPASENNLSYTWAQTSFTGKTVFETTVGDGSIDNDLDYLNLMAEYMYAIRNTDGEYTYNGDGTASDGTTKSLKTKVTVSGCSKSSSAISAGFNSSNASGTGSAHWVKDLTFTGFGNSGTTTQADLTNILNVIEACTLTASTTGTAVDGSSVTVAADSTTSWVKWLRTITGAKNPIYFMKYTDSDGTEKNEIIGQESTDGVESITLSDSSSKTINTDRITELQNKAPSSVKTDGASPGGVFTPTAIQSFFIAPSSSNSCSSENYINPLTDHATISGIDCWADIAEAVPTYVDKR